MENRVTSNNIIKLEPNELFVFGSNLSGFHGKGAAKTALKWGAKYGEGVGLYGQTYALPTVYYNIKRSLTIQEIKEYVDEFISFANENKDLIFLVTEVGCKLAGHKVSDIAPLFKNAVNIENIHLPERFWDILNLQNILIFRKSKIK